MTTCARCGQVVAPGTTVCPRCGIQLQPNPSASPPMPNWMQGVQPNGQIPMPSSAGWGSPPAMPGAAGQAPEQIAPGTLSVGSLVSEDALPDWVLSADPSGTTGSQAGWGAQSPAGPGQAASGWGAPPPAPGAPAGWSTPPAQMTGGWGAAPPFANGHAGTPGPMGPPAGPQALFDDASLPDWLRTAAADQPPAAQSRPPLPPGEMGSAGFFVAGGGGPMRAMPSPPAAPPSMAPPPRPNPAYPGATPSGSMPANALLDASALPTWLGGTGAAPEPRPPSNALGGDGLAAGSLVDERSLPLWLRQQTEAPPPSNAPPAGTVSEWLAAPVTDEPLPSWLNQVYSSAHVPRIDPGTPLPSPFGPPSLPQASAVDARGGAAGMPGGATPMPGGMPVGQLLDDAALPDWLRAQASAGAPPPASGGFSAPPVASPSPFTPAAGVPPGGGWSTSATSSSGAPGTPSFDAAWGSPPASTGTSGAFSASDLIDPGSLPGWVQREQAQPEFSSVTGWTSKQQANPPAGWGAADYPREGAALVANGYEPQPGNAWAPASIGPSGDASLPPWLQGTGAGSTWSGPAGSGGMSGRQAGRLDNAGIPPSELPPWLRGGASPNGGPGMLAGMPPAPGWSADGGMAGAMSASGPAGPARGPYPDGAMPYADRGSGPGPGQPFLYADRFGDERPADGSGGRFGYAYDFGGDAGANEFEGWDFPPEEADEPATPAKKRRRLFGRK